MAVSSADSKIHSRMLDRFSTFTKWMVLVGSMVLFLMMIITVVDVGGRYIFFRPLKGAYELVGALLVFVVSWGLAYCEMEKAHIAIDLVTRLLSPRKRAIAYCFSQVISLGIFSIITWQFLVQGIRDYGVQGESTAMLGIPLPPLMIAAGLAFGVFCLALLVNLAKAVMGVTK
jgi:TRAP-type C4-dicarboxylate transport system permease small subunit